MDSGVGFLLRLAEKGVALWLDGERIRFSAPKGSLLPADKEQILRQRTEISELLRRAEWTSVPPLRPRSHTNPVSLTAIQRRFWNYARENAKLGGTRAFGFTSRVQGPLDIELLQASIDVLVQRHESLRTAIVASNVGPRMHVIPHKEFRLNVVDLSALEPGVGLDTAREIAETLANENVYLSGAPHFEARLLRLSAQDHVLALALSHAMTDRLSTGILEHELWSVYFHKKNCLALALPPLAVQFADYASWQQQTHGAWMKSHGQYWLDHLRDAQALKIPHEKELQVSEHPTYSVRNVALDEPIILALRDISRSERTLLSLVVFTVYAIAISRWCQQHDLVIAFVTSGRYVPALEGVVGPVANFAHLRIQIDRDDDFLDLLRKASDRFTRAGEHPDFDRVPELFPELLTTEFHFNWLPAEAPSVAGPQTTTELAISPFRLRAARPLKFAPVFTDAPTGVIVTVRYRADLVSHRAVEKFCNDFHSLATTFAAAPTTRIRQLPPPVAPGHVSDAK